MLNAEASQTSAIQVAPARRVTIPLAEAVTGLSGGAMRTKIARGVWLEGREYFRDPQGGIWIDLQGVQAWVASATVSR
jgi:integrase